MDDVTVGVTSGDSHFRFGCVYGHTYKDVCSTWIGVVKYCIQKVYCHENGIFFKLQSVSKVVTHFAKFGLILSLTGTVPAKYAEI